MLKAGEATEGEYEGIFADSTGISGEKLWKLPIQGKDINFSNISILLAKWIQVFNKVVNME